MDVVVSLAVALARASGVQLDVIKVTYGIRPDQMQCVTTGICNSCGLCPVLTRVDRDDEP